MIFDTGHKYYATSYNVQHFNPAVWMCEYESLGIDNLPANEYVEMLLQVDATIKVRFVLLSLVIDSSISHHWMWTDSRNDCNPLQWHCQFDLFTCKISQNTNDLYLYLYICGFVAYDMFREFVKSISILLFTFDGKLFPLARLNSLFVMLCSNRPSPNRHTVKFSNKFNYSVKMPWLIEYKIVMMLFIMMMMTAMANERYYYWYGQGYLDCVVYFGWIPRWPKNGGKSTSANKCIINILDCL